MPLFILGQGGPQGRGWRVQLAAPFMKKSFKGSFQSVYVRYVDFH